MSEPTVWSVTVSDMASFGSLTLMVWGAMSFLIAGHHAGSTTGEESSVRAGIGLGIILMFVGWLLAVWGA